MAAVARPRILLVPTLTELEWQIKPLLEEWAEVASFDVPGVGEEPPIDDPGPEAVIDRGVAEIDRRGWDRCVVVGDEFGVPQAIRIAAARPDAIEALALGHATLDLHTEGPEPALNGEVREALTRMIRTDFRSYVRALSQVTQHAYDDEFADRYMERVPQEMAVAYEGALMSLEPEGLEEMLRSLDVPMLLVEHKGCLMWQREGFEEIVKAFPAASTGSMELKPSVNPEFAALLREFCGRLTRDRPGASVPPRR
jgi:pimeloyl-ACP methyl ester carboxylesterase